jgi:hypothetical protein
MPIRTIEHYTEGNGVIRTDQRFKPRGRHSNLSEIARLFGTTSEALLTLNIPVIEPGTERVLDQIGDSYILESAQSLRVLQMIDNPGKKPRIEIIPQKGGLTLIKAETLEGVNEALLAVSCEIKPNQ